MCPIKVSDCAKCKSDRCCARSDAQLRKSSPNTFSFKWRHKSVCTCAENGCWRFCNWFQHGRNKFSRNKNEKGWSDCAPGKIFPPSEQKRSINPPITRCAVAILIGQIWSLRRLFVPCQNLLNNLNTARPLCGRFVSEMAWKSNRDLDNNSAGRRRQWIANGYEIGISRFTRRLDTRRRLVFFASALWIELQLWPPQTYLKVYFQNNLSLDCTPAAWSMTAFMDDAFMVWGPWMHYWKHSSVQRTIYDEHAVKRIFFLTTKYVDDPALHWTSQFVFVMKIIVAVSHSTMAQPENVQ